MATISSFPTTVDFRAHNAIMPGAGGTVEVRPDNSLLITLPPGGQSEGGYGEHAIPRTKTLHVRQRITALAPLPPAKWLIAMRSNDAGIEHTEGCRRFVVETHHYNNRFIPYPQQGVCSRRTRMLTRDGQQVEEYIGAVHCDFDWNDYIGQEVSLEYEGRLLIGRYAVYVSTQDGRYNQALLMNVDLTNGYPFNPTNDPLLNEQNYQNDGFTSLRPMLWNDPSPAGTQCILHEMVVSDRFIGSPYGVSVPPEPEPVPMPEPAPAPEPTPAPTPVPTRIMVPDSVGGRMHVFVNGVEVSDHTQWKDAHDAAGKALLLDHSAEVIVRTDDVRVSLVAAR